MMLYTGERNYGCRFLEVSLFGLRAIILENEKIRTMFLLDKGTEIIEFNYKESDTDFVWRSPQGLSSLKSTQYLRKDEQYLTDYYTGGWFEVFPSLGGSSTYKGANLPFYGEVCYLPWEYAVEKDTPDEVSIRCFVRTVKTPYFLEKIFTVKSNLPSLFIEEKVTNLGKVPMEFQWGHHPNFGSPFLDENCIIDLPEAEINVYGDNSSSRVAGGAKGIWPVMQDRRGDQVDFRHMLPKESGISDLLFLSKLKAGWGAVRNTKTGIGIGLSWDVSMFGNCIVWLVANGDKGYPRYGDTYVLCLMPKSSDKHGISEGTKDSDVKLIQSGESVNTWLTVTAFRDMGTVAGINRNGIVNYSKQKG